MGLDIIPEVGQAYGFDTVSFNSSENVIRFHRGSDVNLGIKLLSGTLSSLYSFEWYSGYTVDTDYWNWMNHGSVQPQYISTTEDGPVTITSQAPVEINSGEMVEVFYAMALGTDEEIMLSGISAATQKYQSLFTSVNDGSNSPLKYSLEQNYPNPFNPSTTISYLLEKSGLVTIKVYDILGNVVTTLINQEQSAGQHQLIFNASELSSGLYFYSIKSNGFNQTKKMILIK
ncbi:MAG: T9SS type A sorting domain-containing protein [Ignavibacteriaceae bacterium]|nr:T9SS type A sorting domain-containing protein [Ignavibacteriaceae bacterium]